MNDYQALAAPVLVVFTALMAILFGWLLRGVVDGFRRQRTVRVDRDRPSPDDWSA